MSCPRPGKTCNEFMCAALIDGFCIGKGIADDTNEKDGMREQYITCQLADGTFVDFKKLCNRVKEFTSDTFAFIRQNYDIEAYLTLEIIPKTQIKRIIFNNIDFKALESGE